MVVQCLSTYPSSHLSLYSSYFDRFDFTLSPFQQWSIEAIVKGQHVLTCAHTGSGKTIAAEFAIDYFVRHLHKKVVYTSPIKALSNQKFYDFQERFPDIRFGLVTGDIKTCPDADVLIMTTEIFVNQLFHSLSPSSTTTLQIHSSAWSWSLDIHSELACVVFDEVHYILDIHRGHVWEQAIMMLPLNVQMVMLSATLHDPIQFASWCESCHPSSISSSKQVYVTATPQRVVPLIHSTFVTCTQHLFKAHGNKKNNDERMESRGSGKNNRDGRMDSRGSGRNRGGRMGSRGGGRMESRGGGRMESRGGGRNNVDETMESRGGGYGKLDTIRIQSIESQMNRLQPLQSSTLFDETSYEKQVQLLKLMEQRQSHVSSCFVLDQVTKHLFDQNLLPAICFVFSRRQLEQFAHSLTTVLLPFDSKVPYTVAHRCEQWIRRLPNFEEYLHLPEYTQLISILEKGIGIHHAGMLPILRELVELLFSDQSIQFLFATETFAVGINMPTKTVLFTDVMKYDGTSDNSRPLLPHEYTQMSGRAGRRGIDTVGHVVHLLNLYREIMSSCALRQMLSGQAPMIQSQFQITYNLVIQLICNKEDGQLDESELVNFVQKSLLSMREDGDRKQAYHRLSTSNTNLQQLYAEMDSMDIEDILEYVEKFQRRMQVVNKERREIDRWIEKQRVQWGNHACDMIERRSKEIQHQLKEQINAEKELNEIDHRVPTWVSSVVNLLKKYELILIHDNHTHTMITLSPQLGHIAAGFSELHPIVFSRWILHCPWWNQPLIIDSTSIHRDDDDTHDTTEISIYLAAILSCFTNITVPERVRSTWPTILKSIPTLLQTQVMWIQDQLSTIEHEEQDLGITTGYDYTQFQGELLYWVLEWCDDPCSTKEGCKICLERMKADKEIYTGEFVKSILKIQMLVQEFAVAAERAGRIDCVAMTTNVSRLIMKFVVTNQSLYV